VSHTTAHSGGHGQPSAPQNTDLSIVVACHSLVCAIPTRYIMRLALNDEVSVLSGSNDLVVSGEERLASFNLGTLLGMPPLTSAWVFLNVPVMGVLVPIALQTGACLFVRTIVVEAPLPVGLFALRGAAMRGAFVAGTQLGLDNTLPYGLVLAIERLWTDKELHMAKSRLERPGGKVQRD
jgi:hypothetical protein